jgi:hypothetical protein
MAALNIPNPHDTPDPWDTLEFDGAEVEHVWPPETNEETKQYGLVEWGEFTAKVKVDKKKKVGAAKPKVTTTGGEAIDFSFTIVVVQSTEALAAVAPILDALRPGAGPFGLKRHPWAALVSITDFIIESVKLAPPSNGEIRTSYSCTQVDKDAQANKGGSVVKTSGELQYEQLARQEFEVQQGRARNMQKAVQEQSIARATAEAKAANDTVGSRTMRKLSSVLGGEGEVDVNSVQPQKPNPAAVAEGAI